MAEGRASRGLLSGVTVVATSRCNQRCSYCYVKGRPPASPPWPAVRVALDALLASPADRVQVGFTGGEPLRARPLIARTVRHVEAHRRPDQAVRYKLLTNGLLLDSRTLSWLERHAFNLQISFDGTRDAQDRRSAGTFDTLDRVVRRLGQNSPAYFRSHVSVAMTLVPDTVPYLADSVSYLLGTGVASIRVAAAMHVPDDGGDAFPELDRQFAKVHQASLAHFWRTGDVPVTVFRKGFPFRSRPLASPWVCRAPLGQSLAVDVDGQVSTCLLATKTYADGRCLSPIVRKAADTLRLGLPGDQLGRQLQQVGRLASKVHVFSSHAHRHSTGGPCRQCEWSSACFVCPLVTTGALGAHRSLRIPSFLCAFNRVVAKSRERFPLQPPPLPSDDVFRGSARRK